MQGGRYVVVRLEEKIFHHVSNFDQKLTANVRLNVATDGNYAMSVVGLSREVKSVGDRTVARSVKLG